MRRVESGAESEVRRPGGENAEFEAEADETEDVSPCPPAGTPLLAGIGRGDTNEEGPYDAPLRPGVCGVLDGGVPVALLMLPSEEAPERLRGRGGGAWLGGMPGGLPCPEELVRKRVMSCPDMLKRGRASMLATMPPPAPGPGP